MRFFFLFLAISLTLGAFSVWPFSKLYTPAVMIYNWQRVKNQFPPDKACFEKLEKTGVKFKRFTPEAEHRAMGCAIDSAVVVYNGVFPYVHANFKDLHQITLSCEMALRVEEFMKMLPPLAEKILGLKIKSVLHNGGYSCRRQQSALPMMSSHAFAEAIDITGFQFENHPAITVLRHYNGSDKNAEFLQAVAKLACDQFGTVIGPPFDDNHADHMHIAIGFPRRCVF